jgi:hypothetical protein
LQPKEALEIGEEEGDLERQIKQLRDIKDID